MSKVHWFALSSISGIGGASARRLLNSFGSIEAVFQADANKLSTIVRPEVIVQLRMASLEHMEQELLAFRSEGIDMLSWDDPEYPENLRPLQEAPPVLFVRGAMLPRDAQAVAIVGSRQISSTRTEQMAYDLARGLAERGLTIISGLALGVDTGAHLGAVAAKDGRTLAVLGCGLRHIYPRQSWGLADRIIRQGALLSELHPNAPPRGAYLMARDRLISGLARAVIVLEAGDPSGSLDTGRQALCQGRRVFTVGGSPGAERLLREGATGLDPKAIDFDKLAQEIINTASIDN